MSKGTTCGQIFYDFYWGSGFLPSEHQGVKFHGGGDPVLYLSNPEGIDVTARREMLDSVADLNRLAADAFGDPEIQTRIAQYEMAFRMQIHASEAFDISREPEYIHKLYGTEPGRESFANNCLLARRLAERGVRCIQLYMRGWDQHYNLPAEIRQQAKAVDQPQAALILDLERRGLLEDTLVLSGAEIGRTVYSQGTLTETNYGRDHHPRCFTAWMAGAGVKAGHTHGATDDYGYNILGPDGVPILKPSKDGATPGAVHVHDLHATILHQLGIDHTRLTHSFQGRRYRLTDVHGHVVREILA